MKIVSTHSLSPYKQPLTENPYEIKGFLNIIQFLEQNPNKVISYLKQKKRFIKKWFLEYLDNLTQVKSRNIGIHTQHFKAPCYKWINDFLSFIDKYTNDCDKYDEDTNKCTCDSTKDCAKKFNAMLAMLCSESCNKERSCNNFIKKLIDQRFLENKNIRKFYVENTLCYVSYMFFGLMSYEDYKKLLDKDFENNTTYTEGIQKRTKNRIPLLDITFKDFDIKTYDKSFKDKFRNYYEFFFKDRLPDDYNIREYELYLINLASLFYQFFWDLLNNQLFRDIPDIFTMEEKSNDKELINIFQAYYASNKDENADIEKLVNNTNSENYDPLFQSKYPYFFQSEWITGEEFFRFLDLIRKFLEDERILSQPVIPESYEKKIKNFIKNKLFYRSRVRYDKVKNMTFLDNNDKTIQERYHNYHTFVNLYNFVHSLIIIRLRNSKRFFDKELLLEFFMKIKEGFTQKKAHELIFNIQDISYGRLNEYLNDWKNLLIGEAKSNRKKKINKIIRELSEKKINMWIEKIAEYEAKKLYVYN